MRSTLLTLVVIALVAGAIGWLAFSDPAVPETTPISVGGKIVKTDEEWRKQLTPEQYRVTRKKGTERPGSGEYAHTKKDGIYTCVCCGQPLFDSKSKFESGTGWPSFWEPVGQDNVALKEDRGWLSVRTEVLCSRCDAHLGHVFDDRPDTPTGLRYCMNSVALKLVDRDTKPEEEK
jgi:peptide-methionine (R)-S-oxide reductase